MDFNRFTEKLQEAVRAAQSQAVRYGHQQIDVEHLLVALLEQEGGLSASILTQAGVKVDALQAAHRKRTRTAAEGVGTAPAASDQIYVTPRLNKLLTRGRGRSQEAEGRLRFGGARPAGRGRCEGPRAVITRERLMQALHEVRGSQRVTTQNPEATYEALEKYGRDLTEAGGATASSIR